MSNAYECPRCLSEDWTTQSISDDAEVITRHCQCADCGTEFRQTYDFTGSTHHEGGPRRVSEVRSQVTNHPRLTR